MRTSERGFFQNHNVPVLSSSHNDIAFLDSPLVTIQFRNERIIKEAILQMEKDPGFFHSMECSLYLKDFLILHPELKERLTDVMKSGQFGCGATFTQCYEGSETSEGLVRQYYLGKRWLEKVFKGCKIRVAWNEDVPDRTMQSAQIMKKCHVDYLFVSRMDAGFFKWYSPDGSFVTGYSTGHYHHNSLNEIIGLHYNVYDEKEHSEEGIRTRIDTAIGHNRLATYLETVAKNYYKKRNIPPYFGLLSIRDYDYPLNLTPYFQALLQDKEYAFPKLYYTSASTFMDEANKLLDKDEYWNTYRGERPNLWIYHEPTHADAFRYNRNGMQILEETERFSALGRMLVKKVFPYPEDEINSCWAKLLYLDHGWGGKNGHITDETYLQTSLNGYEQARSLRKRILEAMDKAITVQAEQNTITVFNASFFDRTDEVSVIIDWEAVGAIAPRLLDSDGTEIPYQIIEEPAPYSIRILFIANIPALGYKRYRLSANQKRCMQEPVETAKEQDNSIKVDNDYYSVVIGKGGITELFDKETRENLVPQNSPLALFEVFVVDSVGNGSGEFSEIQQPSLPYGSDSTKYWLGSGYTESAGRQNIQWHIPSHEGMNQPTGTVATIVVGTARFPHFVLKETLTIFNHIKKIKVDINIEAFDGTMYKEIRLHVPLPENYSSLSYEVPFGILHVGKDEVSGPIGNNMFEKNRAVLYPTDCREIRPREIQTWLAATDGASSILLAAPDTPACDVWRKGHLFQPILLATRHSCMDAGNPYTQIGNHSYTFSYVSVPRPLQDALPAIEEEKHPFNAVCSYHQYPHPGLPQVQRGIEVGKEIRLSAFKKAEDSDELVLRVYEPFGRESAFRIKLAKKLREVRKTDMLEYEGEKKKATTVDDCLSPFSIETYCVSLDE